MRAFAVLIERSEGGSEGGSIREGVNLLWTVANLLAPVSKETGVKMNELEFAMLLQLNETGRLPHSVVFWELD